MVACNYVDIVNGFPVIKNTYKPTTATPVTFKRGFKPSIAWTISTRNSTSEYNDLTPWIQKDAIVVIDSAGKVSSYEQETGSLLWQIKLNISIVTGVSGGSGLILVASQEGEVLALNETNGDIRWRRGLSREILSLPTASNNVVITRSADGRLTGLSTNSGKILWSHRRNPPSLSLRGTSTPLITENKVIAGYANGELIASSIIDGNILWETSIATPRGRTEVDRIADIDSTPVIRKGIIYVIAYHGNLAAIELDKGKILWSNISSSLTGIDVAIEEGREVFVSEDGDYITAFQAKSGDVIWQQTGLLLRKITAPIVTDKNIIVGDSGGYIHWLSRRDGKLVARWRVANVAIRSTPIVIDDLMYIYSTDGILTAIKIK